MENVEIKATPSAGRPVSVYTDEYGNHTINLLSGNYELTATLENYTSQNTHQLNLTVGQTINDINFILFPNDGYIEGTVTSGGSGLADVTVTVGDNQDITDDLGNYSIDVSPGTYIVSATKTGYTSNITHTISVYAGQTIQGINFVLSPNASVVSGTVS
ncbi:MAG: carboxypeptidase regulatory-like domain-containing protein, partial [Candidatus Cloacimonetes bacterium]|nr:carboxypeptidase regulatory-like domain-containing protein [Candidatus Cloacimonadota bacterium]